MSDIAYPKTSRLTQALQKHTVVVSAEKITHQKPNGSVEAVAVDQLKLVLAETSEASNGYWILMVGEEELSQSNAYIPMGSTGEEALIEWLRASPGFDAAKYRETVNATDGLKVIIWKRPAA